MSIRPSRRTRRRVQGAPVSALLGGLLLGLPLVGCGAASPPSPPSGVDQLTVPTPSPRPTDFVARIDNPWLALEPGETVTFESDSGDTVTLQVAAQTVPVAGLDATAVRRSEARAGSVTDYLAQDDLGNVWWVGREGVWEAGVEGARAGLAMPADPRVGDGWRTAQQPDVVEGVAEVVALGEPLELEDATYDDTVVLEVGDRLTGKVRQLTFARGTGLVLDRPVVTGSAPDPLGTLVRRG